MLRWSTDAALSRRAAAENPCASAMPQVVASPLPEPSAPFAARSTTPAAFAEAFASASKFTTYNNH